ncbi:MAG: MAPEG family protein [Gammaproteobacteria bacterium]
MINLIVLACLLAVIQLWIIPAIFNLNNVKWMTSNRDTDPAVTATYKRAVRAWKNLQETLPIFLTLAILGVVTNTDLEFAMQLWIAFRVAHLVMYMTSLNILRTLSWVGSLTSLGMMGLALI